MLDVSAAYTAAIKNKNRTDRIAGTIKLCDGETISITDDIIVNNSVTLKEQLVSGDTFEIGTFYTNQLDITVYDENFLTRTYANARITPKYEIQLADGTWGSVPLGIFTVDNSLTKRKGSIHKLTAFDDSTKFDVDISAYSGGKKTVQQHIKDLAADVGITLVTTDFSSYPNYNLIVDSTVSSSVQTYRDLIEWCCALMAASARIDRHGKLEIVKLKEKKKTVDGVLVYDADYTVEGYERTGTEFFDLRALTKYFSTTFDGEQYVYANNSTLDDTVARKATLFLPENPLLRSVSDAERKSAFEACAETISIALRRVEFSFNGNPAIECFDTLCGNGGKIDVDRTIAFFPTSLVWKYRGAHKVSCAFAELTDEATVSASEAAILVATEASTISKIPVQVKSKTEKRLDGVGKTASDAGGVGKFTNTDRNCEIFNDYSGNTAYGNYSHVEGYENRMDSEGAIHSWATHIEGAQNTEASQTSCPSDKKASYNHIEGRRNNCWGRLNHVEGVNCFAEYDTQMCHVEGNNSYASEGARVTHVEGKNCVAGGNCTHAQNLGTIAEKDNCTALGKYNKDLGYAVMIGGGSSDTDRKNILIVAWDGTVRTTGGVDAGGNISGINGTFGGKLSVLGDANFYGKTNFKVPIATKNAVGGIKVGENLSISEDGTLSASGGNSYVLPSATADTLGGVKIGDNISVTADGVISVDMSEYLKNADIADWAKAESKPVYTADEVGAAEKNHTHNMSDISDMPEWTKTENKPAYTAEEVGAATAADISQAVGNIRIGGRNLATGTAEMVIGTGGNASGQWRKSGTGTIETIDITDAPCNVHKGVRLTLITNNHQMGVVQDNILLNKDSVYTLSCWVRSNSADGVICRLQPFYKTADHGGAGDFAVKNSWQKISLTAVRPPQTTTEYSGAYVYLQPNDIGSYLDICGIQLESGNKVTDWSPAPEDDERRITSLEARVAALEAMAVSGGEV